MQQITIGTKNQIVIPKEVRNKVRGLNPGSKVSVYRLNENTVAIKVDTQDWVDSNYGVMKKAWESYDPIDVLKKMREEW